ncbi:hypothetical protein M426DRAFT_324256 [Hypoxylon sp. CI-4A]|nr:hypothetical protein M426DRAFT_324256 [Hypoxylon sp. CI-4A]
MVFTLNTESLNALCSKDQLELLDAIDHLRLQGIESYISLPQIIVCGDQSSGKSSVLEAISGVPFPVKSNLCTCFPTELILRRSTDTGVTISIIPESKKSTKDGLQKFREELDGFEGFPELIEKAKVAMGISASGKAFSKDRLRVEISGPDRPHLTIIDMPGLIHSETKSQTAADVKLVREVVKTYMKQPRTIILAVVSAKNDFANQVVLNLAQTLDKHGTRTMGVITKPDTLVPGSGSERLYVSLAKNKEVKFDLGWHVLKNLDSETQKESSMLGHRNTEETRFFSSGAWSELSPSMLGIGELRKKLSSVLLRQIALELPSLVREIDLKLDSSREQLEDLGEPRRTLDEQRLRLLEISKEFQSISQHAISGTYDDAFFEDAETTEGYQQRIRAVVQEKNKEFAARLVKHGHRREVSKEVDPSSASPELITREKFVDHVQRMMQRTRGRELPGTFSTMVISDLFYQQSSPWESIVKQHVVKAWEAVQMFVELVVTYVAEEQIGDALLEKVFRPALRKLLSSAKVKAGELLNSQRRVHPITYNHEYVEAVQKIGRHQKDEFTTIIQDFFGLADLEGTQYLNRQQYHLTTLVDRLAQAREPDIERLAASEALDRMDAYYHIALKRFIDSIATEVIEQRLLAEIADILSPVAVYKMRPDLVETIAGESQKSRKQREELTKKIDVLQKGLDTCRRFIDSKLIGKGQSSQPEEIDLSGDEDSGLEDLEESNEITEDTADE